MTTTEGAQSLKGEKEDEEDSVDAAMPLPPLPGALSSSDAAPANVLPGLPEVGQETSSRSDLIAHAVVGEDCDQAAVKSKDHLAEDNAGSQSPTARFAANGEYVHKVQTAVKQGLDEPTFKASTALHSMASLGSTTSHASVSDTAGGGLNEGGADSALDMRRPTSIDADAVIDKSAQLKCEGGASEKPSASITSDSTVIVSTNPEADNLTLLKGKRNRVWKNGRWHRLTEQGHLVLVELGSKKHGDRGSRLASNSACVQSGMRHSRSPHEMRVPSRESREARTRREALTLTGAGHLSHRHRHSRIVPSARTHEQRAAKRPLEAAAELSGKERKKAEKGTSVMLQDHRGGLVQLWKMTKPGSHAAGTLFFEQVLVAVYLYEEHRDVSLRADDTGLYWSRGRDERGQNRKWSLLENGLFESQGLWKNANKNKMLIAQYSVDGKTSSWREFQNDQGFACFEELHRKIYLRRRTSPGSLPETSQYICIDGKNALMAEGPEASSCAKQVALNMLESLQWRRAADGIWNQDNNIHFQAWKGSSTSGAGGSMWFSAVSPSERWERTGVGGLSPHARGGGVTGDGACKRRKVGVGAGEEESKDKYANESKDENANESKDESANATAIINPTMSNVSPKARLSHDASTRGRFPHHHQRSRSNGKRVRNAGLSLSHRKRALDDGGRGVMMSRTAEEARAAKKKARKEKEEETRVLAKKLADQGLCTIEIPADGHCLFSALSDQLKRTGCPVEHNFKSLRKAAAGYMMRNEQHFRGFLSLESNTFESYCRRIERTNAWGGQHELIALSHVLKRNIQVLRHDMSIQMFPDPETHSAYSGEPLRLSYHIHEYSGGEHYNSVVTLEEKNRRSRPVRAMRSTEEGGNAGMSASGAVPETLAASPLAGVDRGVATEITDAALLDIGSQMAKVTKDISTRQVHSLSGPNDKKLQGGKQGVQKLRKEGKVHKKGGSHVPKALVPWVRGEGGESWRVVVWDTRNGRLVAGNACPTAKNIDRYLEDKPYMRVWKGGIDGEPRPAVRSEVLAQVKDGDGTHEADGSAADCSLSRARALSGGSAPDGADMGSGGAFVADRPCDDAVTGDGIGQDDDGIGQDDAGSCCSGPLDRDGDAQVGASSASLEHGNVRQQVLPAVHLALEARPASPTAFGLTLISSSAVHLEISQEVDAQKADPQFQVAALVQGAVAGREGGDRSGGVEAAPGGSARASAFGTTARSQAETHFEEDELEKDKQKEDEKGNIAKQKEEEDIAKQKEEEDIAKQKEDDSHQDAFKVTGGGDDAGSADASGNEGGASIKVSWQEHPLA